MQGLLGRRTGHTGLGGWGVQPRGWSEFPAGPAGMDNRAHRLGGAGSPAQGVVGASCRARGGVEPGHLPQRTGRSGLGGAGSPARGVFGASCQANGGPSSLENRAHRPGGDGESCPGGVRSLLPGQWGAIFFREPGAPAWGGPEDGPPLAWQVWCGVVWYGVVWCGVVWYGVVWCGVVW